MVVNISEEVKDILRQGRCEGMFYFLPPSQLDRLTYEKINKALEALEGKWNKSKRAHIFPKDANECLATILSSETITDRKTTLQFFETPPDIAERVIQLADIRDGMTVLEPSAGRGALLEAIHGSPDIGVIAIEIDPDNCAALEQKKICPVICGDFLKFGDFGDNCDDSKDTDLKYCLGSFERVIMNPPFAKQQDIDHVTHAWDYMVAEGGRIVAIMSPGFTFRTNKKSVQFRELVEAYGYWENLPENAFKSSGTSVRTIVVVLNKPIIN